MSDSVTLWTVAYQVSLPMGFSRQEYWTGLPFPSPGIFLIQGWNTRSPALQADSLLSEPPGKPYLANTLITLLPFGLSSKSILHCLLAQGDGKLLLTLFVLPVRFYEKGLFTKKKKLIRNCVDCDILSNFYCADSKLYHPIISDALAF